MNRRVTLSFAAALLVGLLAVCIAPASGDATDQKSFTFIYNVNNSGYVDVCGCKHKEVRQGSLARRSSFLKQYRATGKNPLLLDGGSTLFKIGDRVRKAALTESIRKARVIVDAYNHMGYQVMAVGAYDIAAGLDTLLELEKRAKFPFVSANMANKADGKLIFKPHVILESNGVRVGVIGLTLNTLTRPFLEKVAPTIKLLDPLETAKKSIAELKPKTDVIIALSHIREETNAELIKALGDLSVVVDPFIQYGNHHTWIKPHEWVTSVEGTLMLRSDGQGARLGIVDMSFKNKHPKLNSGDRLTELVDLEQYKEATEEELAELSALRKETDFFHFTRQSIEPHHLQDPEVDRLVEAWKKNIDPAKLEFDPVSKGDFTTHEKCQSCHTEQYAFWKKTSHASAYATLTKSGDEHRYDCVGCHSLGYGQAFVNTKEIGNYADVQCESCHGNQPKHGAAPAEHKYGTVKRLTCLHCHNKEQTLKEFNFFRGRKLVACPKMKRAAKTTKDGKLEKPKR